jgi:glucosamine--fructose-6-phosphate aminotransferase (isomerizing)
MCGIVAYLGKNQAYPILIDGLKRLEYRGYDSSGIALLDEENLNVYKKTGKVAALETFANKKDKSGQIGIGHTRWATHGIASDNNAHPHCNDDSDIALVHNGIIENYAVLKEELIRRGHQFYSETDTEVLIHLIDEVKKQNDCSLEKAVQLALRQVEGAYAIVVLSKNDPEKLVAARKSSPLVIGLDKGEFYLGSDVTPFIKYTQEVIYLDDEEIAVIKSNGDCTIRTVQDEEVTPFIQQLEENLEEITKGDYEDFMMKEIFEQPSSVHNSMRGRLNPESREIVMAGISENKRWFENANRIIVLACGTSWHAGLVGEFLLEEFGRIPVEVEYASEFRYRNPVITESDIVIAISQSGETADTLAAIEMAKERGAFVFGICNVAGSSISRLSHAGAYTHAGSEIGVASTKAFTAQLTVLTLLALEVGKIRNTIDNCTYKAMIDQLAEIPKLIEQTLTIDAEVEEIAANYSHVNNFLYLGRGYNYPMALEGALKLKEISYIHAEGYAAAEMKHGPIALIDESMPTVVIATKDSIYGKVISNMQEVKARKGKIIAIVNERSEEILNLADHVICIPEVTEQLTPFLTSIPLQLLSYYIAKIRGCNVDQPRNLAKSVTVE